MFSIKKDNKKIMKKKRKQLMRSLRNDSSLRANKTKGQQKTQKDQDFQRPSVRPTSNDRPRALERKDQSFNVQERQTSFHVFLPVVTKVSSFSIL